MKMAMTTTATTMQDSCPPVGEQGVGASAKGEGRADQGRRLLPPLQLS